MEDASEKLDQLARSEKQCTKCEELVSCRLRALNGAGHPHAAVMFVSLHPSPEDEAADSVAGTSLVNDLAEYMPALSNGAREKAYFTTLVKCVPRSGGDGVRDPRQEEKENCFSYLSKEISITTPHYVVAIGEETTRYLLGKLFKDMPYQPGDSLELRCFDSPAFKVIPVATPDELRQRDDKTRKAYSERLHTLAGLMGLH
jgi:uracil-DNA glycosylase family 4